MRPRIGALCCGGGSKRALVEPVVKQPRYHAQHQQKASEVCTRFLWSRKGSRGVVTVSYGKASSNHVTRHRFYAFGWRMRENETGPIVFGAVLAAPLAEPQNRHDPYY